jgi:hypothetical protein
MTSKRRNPRQSGSDDLVQPLIRTIRGQKVILDADLAALYEVPTFRFNEAVKRNADRFPKDFRFRLNREEFACLRAGVMAARPDDADNQEDATDSSQIAMSSGKRRSAVYLPWAFTEHGALMAANILSSPRAVEMSVFVIRAFVRMREALATNAAILKRLAEIDRTLLVHDTALRDLYGKLRPLLSPPPEPEKPKIGFHRGNR